MSTRLLGVAALLTAAVSVVSCGDDEQEEDGVACCIVRDLAMQCTPGATLPVHDLTDERTRIGFENEPDACRQLLSDQADFFDNGCSVPVWETAGDTCAAARECPAGQRCETRTYNRCYVYEQYDRAKVEAQCRATPQPVL